MFLYNLHDHFPKPGSSYIVSDSIMAGKIIPNIERQTAPTNEMNPERLGTTMAITTVVIISEILIVYSDRFGLLVNFDFTFFQIISIGT